jgi:phage shock protein A
MFEILSIVALALGLIALVLVLELRSRVGRLDTGMVERRQREADVLAAHEAVHQELGEIRRDHANLRREVDSLGRQVAELKAATEVVPAPPLPRGRSASLDDLREQLRASHLEPGEDV